MTSNIQKAETIREDNCSVDFFFWGVGGVGCVVLGVLRGKKMT